MPANRVRGIQHNHTAHRGGSGQHILLGLGVAVGAVAAAALIARVLPAADDRPETHTDYDDPQAPKTRSLEPKLVAAVWPPLLMALTVSGLRIWNAPKSPARTQALTLWGMAQALNATWMALGARRLGGKVAATVASLGTASAYVLRARRVEGRETQGVAPYAGWMGVASALTGELRRKQVDSHTLH